MGLSPCAVNPLLYLRALRVAEEGLSHCVVSAISTPTHALAQSAAPSPTVDLIAAKLATRIQINDVARFGRFAPHRHHQRISHQACLHLSASTLSHNRK